MRDNAAATECSGLLMHIHTCVKEKGGYFKHKLWHFNSAVTVIFLLTYVKQLIIIIRCWIMVWNILSGGPYLQMFKMWRHNYVIGRNEYLISTLSESTIPWVYSIQFLFKSTHSSWRYERKCEWVFFLNTVYNWKYIMTTNSCRLFQLHTALTKIER